MSDEYFGESPPVPSKTIPDANGNPVTVSMLKAGDVVTLSFESKSPAQDGNVQNHTVRLVQLGTALPDFDDRTSLQDANGLPVPTPLTSAGGHLDKNSVQKNADGTEVNLLQYLTATVRGDGTKAHPGGLDAVDTDFITKAYDLVTRSESSLRR
ncbi:MAG: hypothetical protein WDN72_02180 [Alphaproteobacteria bacterium]